VSLAQLKVVERLEAEVRPISDLPERDVVLLGLPVRSIGVGQVRQRGEELIALLTQLGKLRLQLLELGLEPGGGLAGLLELRIVGLAGAGRLLDLARQLVLLGADLVDARDQLAAAFVRGEDLVELLARPPPGQRGSSRLGIAADLLEVERGSA
jgi:hypothetical protein